MIMNDLGKVATVVYNLDEHELEVIDARADEYRVKWNK